MDDNLSLKYQHGAFLDFDLLTVLWSKYYEYPQFLKQIKDSNNRCFQLRNPMLLYGSEALRNSCDVINSKKSVFEKALLALVLISYIQPFMDGNKRTARIVSNAILMNEKHCPLSFRTVDSIDNKKAMLLFYEQNNISKFKEIFINQFEFAVKTYF